MLRNLLQYRGRRGDMRHGKTSANDAIGMRETARDGWGDKRALNGGELHGLLPKHTTLHRKNGETLCRNNLDNGQLRQTYGELIQAVQGLHLTRCWNSTRTTTTRINRMTFDNSRIKGGNENKDYKMGDLESYRHSSPTL